MADLTNLEFVRTAEKRLRPRIVVAADDSSRGELIDYQTLATACAWACCKPPCWGALGILGKKWWKSMGNALLQPPCSSLGILGNRKLMDISYIYLFVSLLIWLLLVWINRQIIPFIIWACLINGIPSCRHHQLIWVEKLHGFEVTHTQSFKWLDVHQNSRILGPT